MNTREIIVNGVSRQNAVFRYPEGFPEAPPRPLARGWYEAVWYADEIQPPLGETTTRLVSGHAFAVRSGEAIECLKANEPPE